MGLHPFLLIFKQDLIENNTCAGGKNIVNNALKFLYHIIALTVNSAINDSTGGQDRSFQCFILFRKRDSHCICKLTETHKFPNRINFETILIMLIQHCDYFTVSLYRSSPLAFIVIAKERNCFFRNLHTNGFQQPVNGSTETVVLLFVISDKVWIVVQFRYCCNDYICFFTEQ